MHRTLLYVPADRIESLWSKAAASGADAVILDLEDGVALDNKDAARDNVVRQLAARHAPAPGQADPGAPGLVVRVNGAGQLLADDVAALCDHVDVPVMLPKADLASMSRFESLDSSSRPVIALVESAVGLVDLAGLAAHPRVIRLALGEADLRADLGVAESAENSLWSIRADVVVASRAADLEPPIGPVSTDWKNHDRLHETTASLRAAGFGARTAIHPDQVAVIRAAFTPTDDEVAAARRIVEIHEQAVAAGRGVSVGDDGRMIDEAVVRSARRLLS